MIALNGLAVYVLVAVVDAPAGALVGYAVLAPLLFRSVIVTETTFNPLCQVRAMRLWLALRRREIVYAYQPIVSLQTGAVVGAEALARWAHPKKGILSPAQWLSATEVAWLEKRFHEYTLRAAIQQAGRWRAEGHPIAVSVNVTPRRMTSELPVLIGELLSDYAVPAAAVTIEVTEAVFDSDAEIVHTATELGRLGVAIALDDFGIGHSAMARLVTLPVRILKVDRSFVIDGPTERGTAVIRAATGLCQELGIACAAEGVETLDALHQLKELGCDYAQGYFISRPIPPDELLRQLGGEGFKLAALQSREPRRHPPERRQHHRRAIDRRTQAPAP